MMSSNEQQKEWIGYEDVDIHHISFPYPWSEEADSVEFIKKELLKLEKKGISLSEDICGFMLETFQGWGAVFYPPVFVKHIERICKENGILLAFDEMQAGFARTGKAFGFQHYDVTPDLICCGKGMGGGVPLSGVIGKAEVMDLPEIGNMSSTHSANPLVCEAGLAVIEEIRRLNLIEETERKGKILFDELEKLRSTYPDRLKYVLGKGLIAAIHIYCPDSGEPDGLFTSRVAEKCLQKGLLVVHTGRESIKIGPPLTITDEALREGVEVIGEAFDEVEKS
jgi:4-aminobutyrate aminotransferase / (S)-3-amino-2-methylpropionate transaminase / 5-aminovalerate transaminase